jgi:hypothetical protein
MNKIIILMLCLLLLTTTAMAFNVTPKLGSSCNYTLYATEYRAERNFTGGIYGRYSNGSIGCFIPSKNLHRNVVINNQPIYETPAGVPEYSPLTIGIVVISIGLGMAVLRKD